jgi:uncharacterized damage-inducible protein DinB
VFRRLDDFLTAYGELNKATERIIGTMTDQDLDRPAAGDHRTLGQIAWHIVVTVPEMMRRTGLSLSALDEHSLPPQSAASILDSYREVSSELAASLRAQWSDDSLLEVDDMYGEKWPRGMTLAALVGHETHHRGQMTVLLRQAGRKVPGIMGPAKEEWAEYGMEAPPY